MTCERTILLVVHTGRDEATEVARRVEKVLGDNGIGLRVLSAEAVDRGPVHLAPDDMRALGVEIEVVDADERAAEGCELVLVLGGDGTFLRAAELARNVEIPVLGRQSRPHRLPRRGRGRPHRQRARARHQARLPRRGAHDARRRGPRRRQDHRSRLGAERGQPGEGAAARRAGSGARGRRTAGVGVRLRRRAGGDADRVYRVGVLRGRADRVAGSGGNPGGAQQRSRAVRPADGDQSGRRRSPSRSRRTATTRWCSATAAAKWWCPRVADWR